MQEQVIALLRCPRCGGAMRTGGASLLCPKGHCYDVSRYGDVNFAPEKRESFYTKALFESRARVFAAGVFDPVIAALDEALAGRLPAGRPAVLVDAGCGAMSRIAPRAFRSAGYRVAELFCEAMETAT